MTIREPTSSSHEITVESLAREIAFESFGVSIGVGVDEPRLWDRIPALIPPHSRRFNGMRVQHHFSMISESANTYTLRYDVRNGEPARLTDSASWVATDVDEPFGLGLLETHLHGTVAFRAPDRIFIHGGAVAYMDRMIILPAAALTGKTTLVSALVRAGATYYSDQFVVLDGHGRVHPYAVPLRDPGADQAIAGQNGDQGKLAGAEPLPVGAVVLTTYRPGAEWRPERLSRGASALKLMSQTVPAREKPDESIHYIRQALEADPPVIEGDRDEAEPLASSLLTQLERQFSGPT